MKELILLVNLEGTQDGIAIGSIARNLGVEVKHLNDTDFNQEVGYLIGLESYEFDDEADVSSLEDKMMVLHNFSDEQIELFLDVCRQAEVSYIPLKAVTTPTNVQWRFVELYKNVKAEFEEMKRLHAGQN
ncbi:MAG: DUF3783 domain-containing protein [Erysipelotrichaceae bacterium]|nr:DUF3783 domain-containing protein [Erysipelotrichaceae bacterium]MDD3810013.1 DUF3783 domain-containing protein [Erysipelotrichaceae bacterium]